MFSSVEQSSKLDRVLAISADGLGAGFKVVGLDRSPSMVKEARRRFPSLRFLIGDAHLLPFQAEAVDAVVLITTLAFLERPLAALREAVRVARRTVIAIVLNRHSLGGLSRRLGPQSRGSLLGRSRDYSLGELRRELRQAGGERLRGLLWSSTLFQSGL